MREEKYLNGRVAWVTGASRGVGRAIAIALARAGAIVCLGARSLPDLEQVSQILQNEDSTAHPFELDLTRRESIVSFIGQAVDKAGLPDILVNNAGIGIFRQIDEIEPEEMDRVMDVNFRGPWYLIHRAVPLMRRNSRGHIINISSLAGKHPFAKGSVYCASKAALDAMTECVMLEARADNIRVTSVAPGSIDTGFHAEARPKANPKDQSWMIDPEQVAEVCLEALRLPDKAMLSRLEIRPRTTGK